MAARAVFLFSSRCWELLGEVHPSGRLTGGFISTGPPCHGASCCPCRAPGGEQHSYQNTPVEEESWALSTLFFACSHVWLCKSSRSEATKSSWGSEPLLPVCSPLPCLLGWCQRAALAQHVILQQGLIPLDVDMATPTPELSRHPF